MAPEAFQKPYCQEIAISNLDEASAIRRYREYKRGKLAMLSRLEGWHYSFSPLNQNDSSQSVV